MSAYIISILRVVAAAALLPLAALACAAPAPTICAHRHAAGEGDAPDCSPHPFDIMAIYALYQGVK